MITILTPPLSAANSAKLRALENAFRALEHIIESSVPAGFQRDHSLTGLENSALWAAAAMREPKPETLPSDERP